MEYDVDEFEILAEESAKTSGTRLTRINCSVCKLPLTEEQLSQIRCANAPCMHYSCFCNLPEQK